LGWITNSTPLIKFSQFLSIVGKLSIDVPMKKDEAARMRNTTAWMNRGNLWRYPRPLSCADCTKSKCHHRLSRVNKLSYFEVSTRRHLSLSLSQIVTSMLISKCQAIVSLSHTHIVTSMLISRCQNIVSLSHRIVTSMLISRCQTMLSLSLSLSHNCHPAAHFQLSNHCLSFPEVVTSMLISRCRTIVSLSLSQRSWPRFPSRTHEQTKRRQREYTLRRSSALKLLGAHLCYTANS
jgi:hypothetical protein